MAATNGSGQLLPMRRVHGDRGHPGAPPPPARGGSAIRRRLRRRGTADAALVTAAAAAVAMPVADPADSLLVGMAAIGIGTFWFLLRRHRDLLDVRRDMRNNDSRLADRGVSLAEWHGGHVLPPWEVRRARD